MPAFPRAFYITSVHGVTTPGGRLDDYPRVSDEENETKRGSACPRSHRDDGTDLRCTPGEVTEHPVCKDMSWT